MRSSAATLQPKNITVQLYTPHPGQLRLHQSKARFRVMPAGRRVGKTTACCNEMIKFSCEHSKVMCAWVAPTYRQSKIAYRLIKQALFSILSHSSDSELRLELPNGSVMVFCSSDNYDALRGLAIHFLIIDECATVAEAAWTEVLRPCLADTKGRAIFIGTPKGRNWFYQLYQRGLDPLYPDYDSITLPTSSNPYVPHAEIESAKRDLPEHVFQQEFMAAFLDSNSGVFTGIDACIAGEILDPDPNCDYVVGWDIAKYQDFSVVSVINCQTMHVDYWQRTNHTDYTVQVADVCAIAQRYNYAYILQDSTGVGDPVLEQVQRHGLRADGYLFTNASKKILIEGLIVGIQNRGLTFPAIEILLGELRQMQFTLTPSRLISYSAPQGAHDDTVMSLALAYHGASRSRAPLAGGDEIEEKVVVESEAVDPFAWAVQHMGGDW